MDCRETTEASLHELASILAVGVIRLHQQRRRAGTQNPPDSQAGRLEVSPEAVLSGTNPVYGRESPTPGARK
jgi:hypothetical protein